MKISGMKLAAVLLLSGIYLSATPASAQIQNAPPDISCSQVENHGVITNGSATHPREIILALAGSSDNEYMYSGLAKNWKDEGAGQSITAVYDATTGRLITPPFGATCPGNLW